MQTILGANGQIAIELAKELNRNYTTDIRLVSRNPQKVNASDTLFPASLLDADATKNAVAGSEIAYLTVGLPINTEMWEVQFPVMMENAIAACKHHQCKLVFFDNTYMYSKAEAHQTEDSPFRPKGRKSIVRAQMAEMLLKEMADEAIEAVICRAPEFYGPGKTQGITNALVFQNIKQGKKLKVPISDRVKRTLIWTPDASRGTALIGNSPDTYGQTWHLPCDDNRLTYKEFIDVAADVYNRPLDYSIMSTWMFKLGGLFKRPVREIQELLPRYEIDNIFSSDKFKSRFPDFKVTTYREGIAAIAEEMG